MPRFVPPVKAMDQYQYQYLGIDPTISIADRISIVPGLRTSAAFFSFLRANLVLPPSTLNSTTSTPLLDPSSSQTLPPLFPSSLATMTSNTEEQEQELYLTPTNPLDEIPPLTTGPLSNEADKIAALKLVADSIAQQRQLASRAIIFHPLTIAAYIALLAMLSQFLYKSREDIGILLTTAAGATMACLVGVRGVTRGYISLAEEMNWSFAQNEDGEEDVIIGSRFGEDIIGATILRLERNGNGNGNGGRRKSKPSKLGGKGVVRAWTTKMRYRGTGVGTEMLEEVVRITREKLGNSAEIGFAAEHANSNMVLPEIFNSGFRKKEVRAARALEAVVESMDGNGRKKR